MPLRQIYLPKWCYVIAYLYTMPDQHRYNEKLFRRLDMATSHARTILNILLEQGFIRKQRDKKIKFIELTDKGVELAQKLWPLIEQFRQRKEFTETDEHFLFPEPRKGS